MVFYLIIQSQEGPMSVELKEVDRSGLLMQKNGLFLLEPLFSEQLA